MKLDATYWPSMINNLEFVMLQTFNNNLTAEEKALITLYLKTVPPAQNDNERRRSNLMAMAFIEGYRFGIKKGRNDGTKQF